MSRRVQAEDKVHNQTANQASSYPCNIERTLVKISNETYALPMDNVVEIVRKPKNEIESINGQAVAVIRDRAIPLVWLHDYFGVPRDEERKNMLIVLVGIEGLNIS